MVRNRYAIWKVRGTYCYRAYQISCYQEQQLKPVEPMVFSNHVLSVALALCTLCIAPVVTHAAPFVVQAKSGQEKAAVLELYTSEGCSSCPPADQFLSRLGDSGWYPRQVVPLSFHVTYWDYIGWRDMYAQEAFEKRQRDIAARQRSRSVYTPQLVMDGVDVRGFGRFGRQLRTINQRLPEANIGLQVRSADGKALQLDLHVDVGDAKQRAGLALYIALYENGLSSQVNAGENSGKTLTHDYVVREFIGPLELLLNKADSHHRLSIDVPNGVNLDKAGVAAFVQNTSDGRVLQALATPLVSSSAMP